MKAYIESLGCASNLADTNRVKNYFLSNGVNVVNDYKDANIIVLMSCGFNNFILKENLKRLRIFRKSGAKVYLGGCVSKINKSAISLVDYAFGPRDLDNLDLVFGFKHSIGDFPPSYIENNKKIIRISTGCQGKCSYCAIKIANGKTISRDLKEIKKDIDKGLKSGITKFVFTSEDNGSWGFDIGLSILDLVNWINSLDGDFTVTLTTIHPKWFVKFPELVQALRSSRIEKNIYFPLQSASNRILSLMNREYTVEQYISIFKQLKKEIPEIKIQSDILVGFPTETKEDFQKNVDFVQTFDVSFLQVFAYTDMLGTFSNNLVPKVPQTIAIKRAKKLISLFLKKNKNVKGRLLVNTNINDLKGVL